MRALALALLMALACGSGQKPKRDRNDAIVFIIAKQRDASIWVDGKFVAEVGQARGGIALKPGQHRIEVRHDSYHTHYELVTVAAKERRKLEVTLAEYLP